MANRIVGNVLIIDSASIAVDFPGAGRNAQISHIAFWASDSTGAMTLSFQGSTADHVVKMASPVNQPNTTTLRSNGRLYLDSFYVNTLTAGTGFIYLT